MDTQFIEPEDPVLLHVETEEEIILRAQRAFAYGLFTGLVIMLLAGTIVLSVF